MRIWDRKNKRYIEEKEYGEKKLIFLYHTIPGRMLLKFFVATKWYAKINAFLQQSKRSAGKIEAFVRTYGIDLSPYEKIKFRSFADFFIRKRTYTGSRNKDEWIAAADGKLLVVPIKEDVRLTIKNSEYEIKDLISDREMAKQYAGGICCVYRLTVDDYHRYVYSDDGKIKSRKRIDGKLHTVRSISEKYRVFIQNTRECTIMETENFDQVIQIEIGAMLVGKIRNKEAATFYKLEEKGYFELGGSTIVQLLKKDVLQMDEDILKQSKLGIETKIYIGERIGKKC